MYDGATYFAWFVLALLSLLGVALVVWIGSLPGSIAARRKHPQTDAINALSWLGLLFGGVGWVVAFVWALYRTDRSTAPDNESDAVARLEDETQMLKEKLNDLEARFAKLQGKGSKK